MTTESRNVAIFIQKPSNIYSNGCYQQAFYLGKAIRNSGHRVVFVTTDPTYTVFEPYNENIHIITLTENLEWMDCIIFASAIIGEEAYLKQLVTYDVRIIMFICGNLFSLHNEEYVFGVHNIFTDYLLKIDFDVWMMPMYSFAKEYIEVLTGKKCTMVDYVWDTDLIEHAKKESPVDLNYKISTQPNLDVLIFEPNMSTHKTSLCPILCLNDIERQDPSVINSIHVFCIKDTSGDEIKERASSHRQKMISSLAVSPKIAMYPRMITPSVLEWFRIHAPERNVVVLTHNYMNNLNFLHLELMYLGYPVIHNCEAFKNNGLWYNDFAFHDCKEKIRKCLELFGEYENYRKRCLEIVNEYLPTNPKIISSYRKLIDDLPKKKITEYILKRDMILKIISSYRNEVNPYTVPSGSYGILVMSSNPQRTDALVRNIRSLSPTIPVCVCIPKSEIQNPYMDKSIRIINGESNSWWKNTPNAIISCGFENVLTVDDFTNFLINPEIYMSFEQLREHGNVVWSSLFSYNDKRISDLQQHGLLRWYFSILYGVPFRSGEREIGTGCYLFNVNRMYTVLKVWNLLCSSEHLEKNGFENGVGLLKLAFSLSGQTLFINSMIPFAVNSWGEKNTANVIMYRLTENVAGHYTVIPYAVPKSHNDEWIIHQPNELTRFHEDPVSKFIIFDEDVPHNIMKIKSQ